MIHCRNIEFCISAIMQINIFPCEKTFKQHHSESSKVVSLVRVPHYKLHLVSHCRNCIVIYSYIVGHNSFTRKQEGLKQITLILLMKIRFPKLYWAGTLHIMNVEDDQLLLTKKEYDCQYMFHRINYHYHTIWMYFRYSRKYFKH